jgi:hypothetical protein
VGAIVAAWVPLTALAMGIALSAGRVFHVDESLGFLLLFLSIGAIAAIVTGALAGGYVVGRWGPPNSVPMGALSGLIAGALAALGSAAAMRMTWVALGGGLSTVVAATSGGAIGAWAGACVRAARPGGAEILLDD